MPNVYRAAVIGCGRMGATIDDEIRGHPLRTPTLPWAHAAAFVASGRTELVAVADVDPAKADAAKARYDVPRAYMDYREMIRVERPEIISIATRPATHAEIAVFAAENGVRGIYCEKPLCCSPEEADRIVEAVARHGVKFNYGANRRYLPVYQKMRELIDAGKLGAIEAIVAYCGTSVAQWWHTHTTDLFVNMSGDAEAEYVQASLLVDEAAWEGDRLNTDPGIEMGFVRFKNGVRAYLTAATGTEFEISGTKGKLRSLNDGGGCQWRRVGGPWNLLDAEDFPSVEPESAAMNLVDDLARAIDTNGETLGNAEIARRSQEIIFGWVESHRRGGARIALPLQNRKLYVGRADW